MNNIWKSKSGTVIIAVNARSTRKYPNELTISTFYRGTWEVVASVPFDTEKDAKDYFADITRKLECLEELGIGLMVFLRKGE